MVHIALLRGINVGGRHSVKMAELKKVFEKMGFTHVKTLIQSGNVVFESEKSDVNKLEKEIEPELEKAFGFAIPVIIRSVKDLEKIVELKPFSEAAIEDKDKGLFIIHLREPLTAAQQETIMQYDSEIERYSFAGREIFCTLQREAFSKSNLGKNVLSNRHKITGTSRNWNTLNKLIELGNA